MQPVILVENTIAFFMVSLEKTSSIVHQIFQPTGVILASKTPAIV
jgi:hypothetical protein